MRPNSRKCLKNKEFLSMINNMNEIITHLNYFLTLEKDWDSYGSSRITTESIEATKKIIKVLNEIGVSIFVAPVPDGGVCIEQTGTNTSLEYILNINPDGESFTLSVWVDDKEVCEELRIDMDDNNNWIYSLEKIFYGNIF